MKHIITTFILIIIIAFQAKANDFTINGTIKNATGKKIILAEINLTGPISLDSTALSEKGEFSLKAIKTDESLYCLLIGNDPKDIIIFINDANNINIIADVMTIEKGYTVTGSQASNDIKTLNQFLKTSNKNSKSNSVDSFMAQIKAELLKYYTQTKSPALQLYVLELGASIECLGQKEVQDLLQKSLNTYPNNKGLNSFKDLLEKFEKGEEPTSSWNGKGLPNISLLNTKGKMVNISDFKKQYVLLDFWASWCGPCRAQSPYLVKAYNKFKNKNFTIVSVSLDKNKEAWLQAITKDNLTWTQLIDMSSWNSGIAKLFHVNAIPFNVLFDPKGNIIASALQDETLIKKLESILK